MSFRNLSLRKVLMIILVVALRFISPTQLVARVKESSED